jgi:hypothetical protein
MHKPQSHLYDLRRHAARSRAAATEIQRAFIKRLADPTTCPLVTELERRASDALMQLAFAAESLYLREVLRTNEAVLNRNEKAYAKQHGR